MGRLLASLEGEFLQGGRLMAVLELCDVSKQFPLAYPPFAAIRRWVGLPVRRKSVHAVSRVSLSVQKGEVMGLVGESGCGKSTLSRLISGIVPPTSGTILFKDKPVMTVHGRKARKAVTDIQMVFQDPYASLNLRHRICDIIAEGPLYHGLITRRQADEYVCEKMAQAGIDPSLRFQYPHQFSGGQRQRISIARALAMQPDFLVCDEAMAALDVSIQAQIINLFFALKEQYALTYLFISHDLAVIRHLSDRVSVMYLGRIVEQAGVSDMFSRPNHPYSQALLDNMLSLDGRRRFVAIKGEIPSPFHPPSGCAFHPRCPFAMCRCREVRPVLTEVGNGHFSACHLNHKS